MLINVKHVNVFWEFLTHAELKSAWLEKIIVSSDQKGLRYVQKFVYRTKKMCDLFLWLELITIKLSNV